MMTYDEETAATIQTLNKKNIKIDIGSYYNNYNEPYYYDIIQSMTDEPNFTNIKKLLNEVQLIELVELILYALLKHPIYGKPFISVELNENYEPFYLNIIFESCGWDEWKSLEIELYSLQNFLKGMVAVICAKGLKE